MICSTEEVTSPRHLLFGFGLCVLAASTVNAQDVMSSPSMAAVRQDPRFATFLADRAISHVISSAVLPLLANDAAHFVPLQKGALSSRASHAALTTVLARSASGHPRLNYVSVFGSLATVAISSTYRPSAQRSATAVLTRWGGQLLWNAASHELKEFWPDIRRTLKMGWGG